MTPERYARICELFDAAVALPPQERDTFLGKACGNDTALHEEVLDLVVHDELGREEKLFDPPFRIQNDTHLAKETSKDVNIDRRIGPYVIRRHLSSGGMGSVYLAARADDFTQQAAIKLIKGEFVSAEMVLRFRHERQVLAALNHPNIAHLLDGGTTEDGKPFFIMEFIEGQPLDRYCAKQHFDVRARLKLFTTICAAIQYAHQRAVIHRDLKPGNILVTHDGQPKVLDFGIARVTDPNLRLTDLSTEAGRPIGTPAYMSPEQAIGDPLLDVRSDVYALGVICYELLTGRLPHDLKNRSIPERLRIITEQTPTPLRSVSPTLSSDLETIVSKAIEKDRDRRYPSVAELKDDVERFLSDKPIQARHPSKWYRFRKSAQRNKVLVGGIAMTLLMFVFGSIGTAWFAAKAIARGNESRRLLAASYADAAKLAVQRGQWDVSLESYDRALEAGYPDSIGMRLDKAKALFAINQIEKAEREAEALVRDGAPGHEADLLLLRGDLLLGRDNARALPLLRRAIDLGLKEKGDEEYARAFLAQTSPEAVEYLRRAAELQPAHPRAGAMLVVMLALLGKFTEAQARLDAVRALYPNELNVLWLQAVLHTLRGDIPSAEAQLDAMGSRLPKEDRKALLFAGKAISTLHASAELSETDFLLLFKGLGNEPLDRLLGLLGMRTVLSGSKEEITSPIHMLPLPPILHEAFTDFLRGLQQVAAGGNQKDAIAAMERAVQIHPEGTLYYILSLVLFTDYQMEQAEGIAIKAAELDGILPIRARALYVAATAEAYLGSPKIAKPDLEKRKRSVVTLRKVLQYGTLRPDQYEIGVKLARNAGELDLARNLLAEWERKWPNDAMPLFIRAEAEWNAGNYLAACLAAQKVLEIQPPPQPDIIEAMRRYLRDAPGKMLQQIQGLPTEGKPKK